MVASYGFLTNTASHKFHFDIDIVVTWQGTSPHDLDRNTEGLSPLRFSHQAIHDGIQHVHLGRQSAFLPSWEPIFEGTSLDVHSTKSCISKFHVGIKKNPINSPTFLHPWLFEKSPVFLDSPNPYRTPPRTSWAFPCRPFLCGLLPRFRGSHPCLQQITSQYLAVETWKILVNLYKRNFFTFQKKKTNLPKNAAVYIG